MDEVTNQTDQQPSDCTIFKYSKVKQEGSRLTKQLNTDGSCEPADPIYNAQIETIQLTLPDFADGLRKGVGEDVSFLLGT